MVGLIDDFGTVLLDEYVALLWNSNLTLIARIRSYYQQKMKAVIEVEEFIKAAFSLIYTKKLLTSQTLLPFILMKRFMKCGQC